MKFLLLNVLLSRKRKSRSVTPPNSEWVTALLSGEVVLKEIEFYTGQSHDEHITAHLSAEITLTPEGV